MNIYFASYYLHVFCVVLTGSFFIVRGIWMLVDSRLLENKPVKVVPHIIDTLILVSAISLTLQIQQYPITDNWLTVKLLAPVIYTLLGIFAVRRGKTKTRRLAFFITALLTYGFIISVTLSSHPAGIFT